MIIKEEFEELAGIELVEQDGKLVYDGDLNLSNKIVITELPDNLKVLGYLDLNSSGVTKLPKGMEIERWLNISYTAIEELPKDIKFGDSLAVSCMKKPFSFPRVLKVEGNFICVGTIIKRIPEEIYAKYYCYLSYSKFDELPKVMEVGSNLYLDGTHITELPEWIEEVYGNFDISNTNITKLSDNLVVYKNFKFSYTSIKELPKGIIVESLCLFDTSLKDYSNLHEVCVSFEVTEEKYEEIKDTLVEHNVSCGGNIAFVMFEPNHNGVYLFENEKGKYIKAEGIFAKIVEQKGNVYHVQKYGDEKITYIITDDKGQWINVNSLEDVKDDLFKTSDIGMSSRYKNLPKEIKCIKM